MQKEVLINRYVARLVIKGCNQRKGFDYKETYADMLD